MSRARKVTDLYERIAPIKDADTFRLVIDAEVDDYVLADLRDHFWNGQGEKPWQVKEINRLLTRRKEDRVASHNLPVAGSEAILPSKPQTLKERIENNLIVFFLATLLSGFLAGLGTYQGALKLVDYTPTSNDSLRALREELERKKQEVTALENRLKLPEGQKHEQRWLRIRGVDGLDGTNARLVARVNGRAYSYPSRAVWAKIGQGMPTEDFPLPVDVQVYEVSFELLTLSPDNQYQQFQSQEVVSVRSWPHEGEYKIFAVTTGTTGSVRGDFVREQSGIARVSFEVR
jgi:hypothetical protein